MPLLSRHKQSPSGGQQQATGRTSPANDQQVCESPLFGTRRQLPSSSPETPAATTSGKQKVATSPTGSSNLSKAEAGQLLGSIPQQITRQQIHYAFSIMDLNKDGMIDVRDLSQMLANLGVPIDEAILSHIMSKLSKRGDRRISESEFLNWISNFIQVSDSVPSTAGLPTGSGASGRKSAQALASGGRSKVGRSATTSATGTLLAELPPSEIISTRNRRGSGSGLVLMRSLSAGSGKEPASTSGGARSSSGSSSPERRQKEEEQPISEAEDLKNDLKAAFLVFDVDGDGFITLDEVRAGLQLLGESWTPAEVRQVFSRCKGADLSGSSKGAATAGGQQQRINIDDFVQLLL